MKCKTISLLISLGVLLSGSVCGIACMYYLAAETGNALFWGVLLAVNAVNVCTATRSVFRSLIGLDD